MSQTNMERSAKTRKRKLTIPHIFIILLGIMLLMAVLTYIIPAGEFDRVEGVDGRMLVVADSFHTVERNPTTFMEFFTAIPTGFVDAGWVIALTFCVGGGFVVLKKTGFIHGAISALARKLSGKGIIIIPILMITFAVIDCFIGMCELCMVYVPIILPLMLVLGFDSITACAVALCGSAAGFTAALANPFTVGIGQKIAGLPLYSGWQYRLIVLLVMTLIAIAYVMRYAKKVKKDPLLSSVYDIDQKRELDTEAANVGLTVRQKLAGLSAGILFVFMIIGVFFRGYDMPEIGAIFVLIGLVSGLVSGMKGQEICDAFMEGCHDVLLGALIVGLARGISVIMNESMIIDTIVYGLSQVITGVPSAFAAVGMLTVQTLLNFLVNSGSGQTVVSMPIMAPLSDVVGVTRQTAVLALQFGDGFSNIVYPVAGYLMATLGLAKVPYEKWLKFILPLFGIWTCVGAVFLVIAQMIQWGPF